MRTLILIVLLGLLVVLAVDSLSTSYGSPFFGHGGWRVHLFGMHIAAEWFLIGLMVLVLVLFPRRVRAGRTVAPPAAPVNSDLETVREINQMLDRMERRIESLETILLDREARVKRTAEND